MENNMNTSAFKSNRKKCLIISLLIGLSVVSVAFCSFIQETKSKLNKELSENNVLKKKVRSISDKNEFYVIVADDDITRSSKWNFEKRTFVAKVDYNTYETVSFATPFYIFEMRHRDASDTLIIFDTLSINDIDNFTYDEFVDYKDKHIFKGNIYDKYIKSSYSKEDNGNSKRSSGSSYYNSEVRDNPKVYQGSEQQRKDLEAIDAYGASHPEFW